MSKSKLKKAIAETQNATRNETLNYFRIFEKCLKELREQPDDRIYQERVIKEQQVQDICRTLANTVEEHRALLNIETGEALGPEVDNILWEEKF